MNLGWKTSIAEFMGLLHATDFNEHRLEYPSHYFPTSSPPYSLHTNRRKITCLCRKKKEREKVWSLDPKEFMDGPCHSSYTKDFSPKNLFRKKGGREAKTGTYPQNVSEILTLKLKELSVFL